LLELVFAQPVAKIAHANMSSSSLRKNSKDWGFSIPCWIGVALIFVFSFRIEDFSCRLDGVWPMPQ
jgi:hypothetical protein